MSNEDLESVFSGESEPTAEIADDSREEPKPEAVEEPPAEQPADQVAEPETPTGEPASDEEAAVPPAEEEPTPEPTMVPLAKAQEYKGRLRDKESELHKAQLEIARLTGQAQANQPKPEPEESPDFWTDPDAAVTHTLTQREQAQLQTRLQASEAVARMELEDYDLNADYFIDKVAPGNPQLQQMALASPDPAKFAYLYGKQAREQDELNQQMTAAGGMDAFIKQREEAAVAAALEAQKAVAPAATEQKPAITPDLTGAQSRGGDPKVSVIADGTEGLRQILGNKA